MKKLILFPFNGNTKEAVTVIENINTLQPDWDLLGFIDDDSAKQHMSFGQYPVLGNRSILTQFRDAFLLACPGRPENFRLRSKIIRSLNIHPEKFATIIHPSAIIGTECTINENTIVMANVVLTANVKIGANVVILPNTVISHDTSIGDGTMIGSNVSISGGVTVGKNCYIGTGSKIINDINIEDNSMIGIGSIVIRNVKTSSIVAGNPARKLYED